ncbi:VanZ family protein [Natrialbaceae archaeon A-gly3]
MSLRLPLLPRPIRWGAVLTVAGLIGYWSLITTPPTLSPTLVALTTTPENGTSIQTAGVPLIDVSHPAQQRHALAYATFGLTLSYAVTDYELSTTNKAVLVFTLATGYGALMEVGQLFQPDRVASLTDVAINALGVTCSLSWYATEPHARFVPILETEPIGDSRT